MFSFQEDTVLDPFAGSGTVSVAAMEHGRNSIAVEIDPEYFQSLAERLRQHTSLFSTSTVLSIEKIDNMEIAAKPAKFARRGI
jgi:DNA modification methylase